MTARPEPFPWQQVMAFGFGVLRLSSEQFWSMTMRELQAAIESHTGFAGERVNRGWLKQAMQQFPDRELEAQESSHAGN